jgi:nitrogen regulatory protein P-II 2
MVRIVCEKMLLPPLIEYFKSIELHGYTVFDVRGEGSRGPRLGDTVETGNVEIELITSASLAEAILQKLHDDYFHRHAIIAYIMDVKVLRKEKFL